jgi:hypothetical protein
MKHVYLKNKITFLILVIFASCDSPIRLNFDKGIIPVVPNNFSEVNSEYDDYNSDLPITFSEKKFSLIFSTNRKSNGNDFDFIYYQCQANSDQVTGEFKIKAYSIENELLKSINTSANELGPCMMYDLADDNYRGKELNDFQKRFFYSTDLKGNLDIQMVNFNDNYSIIGGVNKLSAINSGFDDAYPTIYFNKLNNRETLYFTSNRDTNFDIYEAISEENVLINNSTDIKVNKVNTLCSEGDDKCPYIKGKIMVFTSNRQGGFGGFDLWYSIYNDSVWSEPKNFGNKINTEFDEYRPVICEQETVNYINDFFNSLMIFSSNRPGGKGGFDLYYVGINKELD